MPATSVVVATGSMVLPTSAAGHPSADADARAAGHPAADDDADSKTRDQVLWDKETNEECCGGDDVQQNLGLIAGLLLSLIPCLLVLVGLVIRTSSSKVTGTGKNRRMQTRRVARRRCARGAALPQALAVAAVAAAAAAARAAAAAVAAGRAAAAVLAAAAARRSTRPRRFHRRHRDTPLLNSTARLRALRGRVPLPSPDVVRATMAKLQRSSCAVVGAAPSLRSCRRLDELCTRFDIVIRVNDHAPVDACGRADIQVRMLRRRRAALRPLSRLLWPSQVANQYACVPAVDTNMMPIAAKSGLGKSLVAKGKANFDGAGASTMLRQTRPGSAPVQKVGKPKVLPAKLGKPCATAPTLFRLRHEWYPPLIESKLPATPRHPLAALFRSPFRVASDGAPSFLPKTLKTLVRRRPLSAAYLRTIGRVPEEYLRADIGANASLAWLSSSVPSKTAHREVRSHALPTDPCPKCAATAGGVAVAFALDVCGSVGLFGLGGGADPGDGEEWARANVSERAKLRKGIEESRKDLRRHGHNPWAERRWIASLERYRRVRTVC